MLKPSDYRSYLKAGMHEPWVPSLDEIRWEDEVAEGRPDAQGGDSSELRKRGAEYGDSEMA